MTPFQRATNRISRLTPADRKKLAAHTGLGEADIGDMIEEMSRDPIWLNDTYQVQIRDDGGDFIHLSIKRIDKKPVHDWRDLQAIKNALVGPENEAIELYPAESRLVDTANQYHLWVLRDPSQRIPVGWTTRLVIDHDPTIEGVQQRSLKPTGRT